MPDRLEKVERALADYEHPLFTFLAQAAGEGVVVEIRFKNPPAEIHTYQFQLHPRDIDGAQFTWNFQRQLYDCLHDYVIEMFTRNPQMKDH